MKVLELFSGTRSIGRAFEAHGHKVFSVDYDNRFLANLHADIETLTAEDVLRLFGKPDVIWASPDCTTYSIAGISHHRRKNAETGELDPISEYAKKCDRVNRHLLGLIEELKPTYYFIENPRGGLRKMGFMRDLPRYTVTYCQYGDTRMKPTDIWTDHPNPRFKPPCHNGDPCHERAPRSATIRKAKAAGRDIGPVGGTQYGLSSKVDRARIPEQLCAHIVEICERPDLADPDAEQMSIGL